MAERYEWLWGAEMYIENLDVLLVIAFLSVLIGFIASIFMEKPFSRWLAYGLVLFPVAATHLVIVGISDTSGKRSPKIGALIAFLLACAALYAAFMRFSPSFQ